MQLQEWVRKGKNNAGTKRVSGGEVRGGTVCDDEDKEDKDEAWRRGGK